MKAIEVEAIRSLRRQGYAITVFHPEELKGICPMKVEDEMVDAANMVISGVRQDEQGMTVREIESSIVAHLILSCSMSGWKLNALDDGDGPEPITTIDEVLDGIYGVSESTLYFTKVYPNRTVTCQVLLVTGNDGYDVIADYGYNDDFLRMMQREVDPYIELLQLEQGEV